MPKVRNEHPVYASRAEMIRITRLCANKPAEREARALIRLAFYSGMRLGEVMAMASRRLRSARCQLAAPRRSAKANVAVMHALQTQIDGIEKARACFRMLETGEEFSVERCFT